MRYLLDTDITNYLIRDRSDVVRRYRESVIAGAEFILSPLVHFEVSRYLRLRGARRLQRKYHEIVADWISTELAGADWEMAIDLWALRHRRGRPIEDADLLIAVTARRTGAILVTNNTGHFSGLGVAVENWMLTPG